MWESCPEFVRRLGTVVWSLAGVGDVVWSLSCVLEIGLEFVW